MIARSPSSASSSGGLVAVQLNVVEPDLVGSGAISSAVAFTNTPTLPQRRQRAVNICA